MVIHLVLFGVLPTWMAGHTCAVYVDCTCIGSQSWKRYFK